MEQEELFKNLYMETLEHYHRVSEELRQEREWNRQNCTTIDTLKRTIEQYERMLDKVSFQVIDGNKY